jgi:hypothetical protein
MEDKYCGHCSTLLVQREDEKLCHFARRKHCDHNCAVSRQKKRVKFEPPPVVVKRYIPGTPEFKEIARLYGG